MRALCLLTLLCVGCATWQQNTQVALDSIHEAARQASSIAEKEFDRKCSEAALQCAALAPDAPCYKLQACKEQFQTFNNAVLAIHYLVIDGKLAITIADKQSVIERIAKATKMLIEMRNQLHSLGWIP